MYQFKQIDAITHDVFVKNHELCNLLQSASWAKVKENWDHVFVGVFDDKTLVASSLVLIKQLPLGFTMMYTPRGPILDYTDERLVTYFFQELRKFAKKKRCLFVKMDPAIHYQDFHLGEQPQVEANIDKIMKNAKKAGLIHQGFSKDMSSTIQPRFQANVYQSEFDPETFSKSTKKMLATAAKKQVKVEKCGVEKVGEFSKLMDLTTERKQIALRGESYFRKLLDVYKDDAFLMMASLDLESIYAATKARHDKNIEDLANCPENAKKKRFTLEELDASLSRECKELEHWLEVYGTHVYIAGTLVVMYGHTSEILYAGMNDEFKRYMAPYATWYESMAMCFTHVAKTCNMGGIDGSLQDGLTKFKRNFNPMINELIGEFDLPGNTLLYKLSHTMYEKRKHALNG
ncbi:UDP-N-acetylmuramoylpentapeptide-lysine N(6)-alanyltransferase [Breznakia blatticola]|uniref:UDP-N-acetylmuramoylpentapeptide-lysine N(6)-alanyltransferase n=1 Tax=Breznakia blatticola TaxID=1754012 RepID=A0A4R8A3N6_9FIRM|nr:aminoacyltransferase [Breznakia blatticola]TDW25102.1 UDP-N-acetylmuramoylpentapeptide-lysine N(6)-alanyltransferase [Breznakia blatticola]